MVPFDISDVMFHVNGITKCIFFDDISVFVELLMQSGEFMAIAFHIYHMMRQTHEETGKSQVTWLLHKSRKVCEQEKRNYYRTHRNQICELRIQCT